MQADIETIKRARAYAKRQYDVLRADYRFSGHSSHAASEAINRAGVKFNIGHGCEGFMLSEGNDGISYLNMGDTYDTTILFDSRSERFSIGCYGDIVERLERQGISLD